MKDSGIKWIGEIPEEWNVIPHKHLMHKLKEIQDKYQGQDIISLTMNGVIIRDLSLGGKIPLTFDGYQKVYEGNLLLCLFDIDVTPRCVGLIRNDGVTSPAYSQFIMHKNVHAAYYDYLLRYMDDKKCMLHLAKNLRNSLTESDFGAIHTIHPPLSEQQSIATYLDTKCGEIDELIGIQEKFIEELKAYKQSVITEAVTKGLNPNAKMKDSGVEWIGEIPEEWEVCKQKYALRLINGRAYKDSEFQQEGKYKILRVGNFFSNPTWYYSDLELPEEKYCEAGDLLYAWSMSYAPIIWQGEKVIYHYHIWKTELSAEVTKGYTYYYLQVLTQALKAEIHETTMGFITMGVMNNSYIPLPPLSEQQSIATYLDNKCSQIDSLITLKQSKIEELKSFKKSLIYEYVTGKKTVPETI